MICHACLREISDEHQSGSFCTVCTKQLFGTTRRHKVSATLPFSMPELRTQCNANYKISISGAQPKFSLRTNEGQLQITDYGGTFLLKPAIREIFNAADEMPANEHVSMQIARQVFGLQTADCAFMQFSDGLNAYITKRFDVKPSGERILQEDFAQVAGLTPGQNGSNYKYDFSYEQIAHLMKKYVSAYGVEVEEFFRLVLFNYIVCNGDAHVKNFSIYSPNANGVFKLTPAYDLLNTSLHVQELGRTALELFCDDFETKFFKENAFYGKPDFMEFAKRIGIREIRAERFIHEACCHFEGICKLLDRSFLKRQSRQKYKRLVQDRIKALTM